MKIYIASSWKNAEIVRGVANRLESSGFEVDAFCRTTDKRFAFHWSEFVDSEIDLYKYDATSFMGEDKVKKAFAEDKKWLDWSDCVILLLPSGKSAHLEAGYAKGAGKKLIIYAPAGFVKGEFDVMYGFSDLLTDNITELVSFLNIKFIDALLPEIADKLGEAVHNMWMDKRRKEKGWHSPEECPKQVAPINRVIQKPAKGVWCDNCHPCMHPYKDLPDSEKELDRAYPAEFIKILDGMGYMLTVKPKINNQ